MRAQSLIDIGNRCHHLLSNRPELQTLLNASGDGRGPSLLIEICVHGLLRSQVPLDQLAGPQATTPAHESTPQRTWVFVGRAEVDKVLQMNENDLSSLIFEQLSMMRCDPHSVPYPTVLLRHGIRAADTPYPNSAIQ